MGSPYMDFEDFNLKEGSTVGVKTVGGKLFYGTIKHLERDRATGEVRMDVVQWDDAPTYIPMPEAGPAVEQAVRREDEHDSTPVYRGVTHPPTSYGERIAAVAIKSGRGIEWVRRASGEDHVAALAYYESHR